MNTFKIMTNNQTKLKQPTLVEVELLKLQLELGTYKVTSNKYLKFNLTFNFRFVRSKIGL